MKLRTFLRAAGHRHRPDGGQLLTTDHRRRRQLSEDGARNHPIAVEPSYRDLKVQFAGGADGMSADDAVKFDAFLADYRVHGNGSLGISVPNGAASRAAITYFARARRRDRHQPRQDPGLDPRCRQRRSAGGCQLYRLYRPRRVLRRLVGESRLSPPTICTPKNFGCSVQHNIAAMVADPRDLLGPGAHGSGGHRAPRHRDGSLREGRNHPGRQAHRRQVRPSSPPMPPLLASNA